MLSKYKNQIKMENKGCFPYRDELLKCKRNLTIGFLILVISIFQISCKKQIEVEAPVTSTNAENVYASDATAAAVLTGIYTRISLSNISSSGINSMSFLPGLSSDELTLFNTTSTDYQLYYTNNLSAQNTLSGNFWSSFYPIIFYANSAIEGLSNSNSLTPSVKQQLLGEAKFIRAFCYFYLVNLYGDVPLALSTDWKINSKLTRTSKEQVWQQVITDLKDAQSTLSTSYLKADALNTTSDRVRPNKWTATALLARAYLYTGDWSNAETQATAVINNSAMHSLSALNSVFLKNSNEAIWQLPSVLSTSGVTANTWEGRFFILPSTGPNTSNYPVYLSNVIVNSFEVGDQRKINWVSSVTPTPPGTDTYYFPYKYKIGSVNATPQEYSMVLRLAEQFLIRAEARAQQNKISEAQADLNSIRTRAGLPNTTASDKASLLTAIMRERKVELFTEWGHRWLDLKRTTTVDAVMGVVTPTKAGTWQTTDQLYPIPQPEINNAPQLIQNSGY